jgi:hypothetical protein
MPEALPPLLAMCEGVAGAERVVGILIPPLVFLGWGLLVWACIWRDIDAEERSSLLGLAGICIAVGGLFMLAPEGISGDGDYLGRFWISVIVAALIGAGWSTLIYRFALWRGIAVAVLGNVLVPGGLVLLLFWALALSGSCLG